MASPDVWTKVSSAACRSAGSGPVATEHTAVASSTVKAKIDTQSGERQAGTTPAVGMRPRVGLRPTMLQKAAGIRPDPAVSVPRAKLTRPVAAATADPDLDPPRIYGVKRIANEVQIGGVETPRARLVDDDLVRCSLQLSHNLPSRFTPHEDAPAGTLIPDSCANLAATPELVRRKIGEVWTMPFTAIDHREPKDLSDRVEDRLDRRDRPRGQGNVVAYTIDIAPLIAEVMLHVDDQYGGSGRYDHPIVRPIIGLCLHCVNYRSLPPLTGRRRCNQSILRAPSGAQCATPRASWRPTIARARPGL